MPGHVTGAAGSAAGEPEEQEPTAYAGTEPGAPGPPAAAAGRHARPAASGTTRRSPSTSAPDELVALEQARLVLRAEHGVAVDRGRLSARRWPRC